MIEVRDLEIGFGRRTIVRIEWLTVAAGEVAGMVGRSGAGKSLTALALTGLAPSLGARVGGSIRFDGIELVGAAEPALRRLRGARIALIMQSPHAALTPTLRTGRLLERTLRLHGASRGEARERALQAAGEVGLESGLLDRFPHQLSGGQAQRLAIAIALALRPQLVIADEPTSALDLVSQREVLRLLRHLRDEHGMAVVLISHDLAVVAQVADRLVVLDRGAVVEDGPLAQVVATPRHAATRALLAAVPAVASR